MNRRSILLVTLVLIALPVRAVAACPTNTAGSFSPNGYFEIQSAAPTWSSSVVCGDFALSLIAGTVHLSGSGGGGQRSCGPFLQASDLYQIVGPATGVPSPSRFASISPGP